MNAERLLKPRVQSLVFYRELEARARVASSRSRDEILVYLAVELHNLWNHFCRSYVLCSAKGLTSLSGVVWRAPNASRWSLESIRQHLVMVHGKKRINDPLSEPVWRRLDVVEACCATLGTGNLPSIALTIGYGHSFLSELPVARNFAAHKSKSARMKLDQVAASRGYPGRSDLERVMLAPSSSGYGTVVLEWITEIERSMTTMCA